MVKNSLRKLILNISSSEFGALILASILPHLDRWWYRLSGGKNTITNLILNLPTLMITTIGAKSGLPRNTPLLYIRDIQNPLVFALIATNFGKEKYPAWYFNLKINPRVICTINGITQHYLAREITGEEYQHYWQLATQTYFGYDLYRKRIKTRKIPIFLLEPNENLQSANLE